MRHWNWIVAAALAAIGGGSGAQAVYRCGSSYGPHPCEDGTAIAAPHSASREEAARAVQAAKVDAKRADALEKARLVQEKNAPKAVVMGPKAAASSPAKTTGKPAAKSTPRKPEEFKATAPAPAKKKT
jgi:hypothetical protein